MSKLIGMHFHLDFYANHRQVYNRINQMEQHTLCVTNQPEIFESCIELYKPTKYVQFGVGFHPQNADKWKFLIIYAKFLEIKLCQFTVVWQKEIYIGFLKKITIKR